MLQVKSLKQNKDQSALKNVFSNICDKSDSQIQCTLGSDSIHKRTIDRNINNAKTTK